MGRYDAAPPGNNTHLHKRKPFGLATIAQDSGNSCDSPDVLQVTVYH